MAWCCLLSMDAVKLIHYVHTVRESYLRALNELPWDEVIKDRGASFPSLRDIFTYALVRKIGSLTM